MQKNSLFWLSSLGILLLLRPTICSAQAEDLWEFCPGVDHRNCDATLKLKREACGPDDQPHEETCNCSQDFINVYVNCQAELTLCSGDNVITPSEWEGLFDFWEQRCAPVISASSITIPTPTRTVSPSEKSKAPLASCDYRGGPDRAVFCTQAQLSASSCFSTTADATHTLGAFPCLCDANLLQLMDRCAVEENLAKCGIQTTEVPWPTRLRSTCRDFGLNPDVPATFTGNAPTPQGTNTPSITFAALGPTSTNGAAGKASVSLLVVLLRGIGLLFIPFGLF